MDSPRHTSIVLWETEDLAPAEDCRGCAVSFRSLRRYGVGTVAGGYGPLGGAELNFGNFAISGIGLAALVGMILNLIIPKGKKRKFYQY